MVDDLLKAAKCKVRYTVSLGARTDEASLARVLARKPAKS